MRVLIIGSGGREHALAWAISASPLLGALFVCPGNPGTAAIATNVPIRANDIIALVAFAEMERIDLVIPGPEAPLVAGIADALAIAGIRCCGPSAAAAELEGSKKFTKEIADLAGIPTAAWESFSDADEAHDYVEEMGAPIVIKADGLAAAKAWWWPKLWLRRTRPLPRLWKTRSMARPACLWLSRNAWSARKSRYSRLCDGLEALYLGCAADHKRVFDNDIGPNTGGMGAISPPPWAPQTVIDTAMEQIIRPALGAMVERGMPFRGLPVCRADVDRGRTQPD